MVESRILRFLSILLSFCIAAWAQAEPAATVSAHGVAVSYRLPVDGPLPKTWRVTLAIVDPKNPDWIISQFACGVARTVTAENGGRFTETWDGLDDNFMPVPPGEYAVKGIYMPAHRWAIDGEWHTVTPRFVTGASSFMPPPSDRQISEPFGGDPVGAPLGDVAVGPNGVAVFYYAYLENGLNNPMFDLKKPLGYEQFLRAFNSGGAGGGTATATDGETVWSFCNEGGMKYVYRADGKAFGKSTGANRADGYLPEGWVTSMAAWTSGGKPYVAVAQRGRIVPGARKNQFVESPTEAVDKITLHDGGNGQVLSSVPLPRPQSITVQNGTLYALHAEGSGFAVSAVAVGAGIAQGAWQRLFTVPATIQPSDLKVDSHGRFYLSDETANQVYELSREGKIILTFGRPGGQKPGAYDPLALMAPGKLATWTDPEGHDRLLIVENAGPNRVSEWSADGKLVREFLTLQTKANDGYAVDPEHPEDIYVPGQRNWLTRFHVDYEKHTWTVNTVWPLNDDPRARGLKKPRLIRTDGRMYLAGASGTRDDAFTVYRFDNDGWKLSAAILRQKTGGNSPPNYFLWHDANGNGRVDDEELTPTIPPRGVFITAHGHNWSDDFAFLAMNQGGQDVWRLAPSSFDAHGNPIFTEWKKLLTDPIFVARAAGRADAVHGGNELAEKFTSDWMQTDGSLADGFYVQARGGKNFSANEGAQHKISRYVPDGHGGFQLKWRTGRTALQWVARPGEMYGGMRIHRPINGLLSVVDQSRYGFLLYNEDGLYVDTVFPDGRKFTPKTAGLYSLPGEFFAGDLFTNPATGKIHFAVGKYTPLIFEAEGWSLTENPVRPLKTVQPTVTISAAQIASPPEIALSLRGGAGTAKFARFAPALGSVAFDGSLAGWESCEPVEFAADKDQSVEVRCLYQPERLLLRWHARLPTKFMARPLPPAPRIFTHDQLADTLSLYFQGDVNAKPNGPPEGRPGDVRLVFGLFQKGATVQPVAVGMYPQWTSKAPASPQTYQTPVGVAHFAHVGDIAGIESSYRLDDDGKGFVLVTAIPRSVFPALQQPFGSDFRTLVNFEATFGGHSKFWWANTDGSANRETYDEPSEARLYPGSWAPAAFQGIEGGVLVRHWLTCGPFGGAGAERFRADPNGLMPGTNRDWKTVTREFCEAAAYPPDNGVVDPATVFKGDLLQGYWPQVSEVRWKPAAVADLDTRVVLGPSAQTWYGATWIHVAAPTELQFHFQSHPMTYLRWFLNGDPIKNLSYQAPDNDRQRPVATTSLTLRAGWNQVFFRGYCTGYPPFKTGLVIDGPAEKLWGLQLSATPPGTSATDPR
jgi:hypothetical protein